MISIERMAALRLIAEVADDAVIGELLDEVARLHRERDGAMQIVKESGHNLTNLMLDERKRADTIGAERDALLAKDEAETARLGDLVSWVEGLGAGASCAFCAPSGIVPAQRLEGYRAHVLGCPLHPAAQLAEERDEARADLAHMRASAGADSCADYAVRASAAAVELARVQAEAAAMREALVAVLRHIEPIKWGKVPPNWNVTASQAEHALAGDAGRPLLAELEALRQVVTLVANLDSEYGRAARAALDKAKL